MSSSVSETVPQRERREWSEYENRVLWFCQRAAIPEWAEEFGESPSENDILDRFPCGGRAAIAVRLEIVVNPGRS